MDADSPKALLDDLTRGTVPEYERIPVSQRQVWRDAAFTRGALRSPTATGSSLEACSARAVRSEHETLGACRPNRRFVRRSYVPDPPPTAGTVPASKPR